MSNLETKRELVRNSVSEFLAKNKTKEYLITPARLFTYLYEDISYIPNQTDGVSEELYPAIIKIIGFIENQEFIANEGFWGQKELQKAFIKAWDFRVFNFNSKTTDEHRVSTKSTKIKPMVVEMEKPEE